MNNIKKNLPFLIALAVFAVLLYAAFTIDKGKDKEIAKLQNQVKAIKANDKETNYMIEDIAWDLNHRTEQNEVDIKRHEEWLQRLDP